MSWAKIDDQFPHHPKIVTAGPIAELLHVRAICYCCRYLTDGFLPSGAVSSILTGLERVGLTTGGVPGMFEVGSDADDIDWAAHMVEHGLWHPCKGGYQVHDFLEYNPTKQQVTAAREATSKRVQSFRQRRPSNGVGNGVTNAVGNGPVTLLPSPSPSLKTKEPPISPKGDDGFSLFWQTYPKKKAKDDAEKAWKKLKPSPDLLQSILAAIEKQKVSAEWTKESGQYIPHPATWLNKKRWKDEVSAPANDFFPFPFDNEGAP